MSNFWVPKRKQQKQHDDDPENIEAKCAILESERQEVFNRSTYEQQQQYAVEETAQWVGERHRGNEFDLMMAEFGARFDADVQRWQRSFRDSEGRRQEIYETNEGNREAVFSEGQSSRTSLFQQAQDARGRRAEWYKTTWESHFREGRQVRKEAYEALEKAAMDQCNKLIGAQEASFALDEYRRDKIVMDLIDEERNSPSRHDIDQMAPPELAHVVDQHRSSSPVNGMEIISPLESLHSLRRSIDEPPALPTLQESAAQPLVDVTQLLPINNIGPSFQGAVSPKPGSSSQERRSLVVVTEGSQATDTTAGVASPDGSTFEDRFRLAQEQRQRSFLTEEEHYENRFMEAEITRDGAEAARTELFSREVQALHAEFAEMHKAYKYDRREADWNIREGRRDNQYKSAQARHFQAFEQALLSVQNQFAAENGLESEVAASIRCSIDRIHQKQEKSLQEARASLHSLFGKRQRSRERLLETKYPSMRNLVIPSMSVHHLVSTDLLEEEPKPGIRRYRGRPPKGSKNKVPSNSTPPGTGFATNALLQGENPHAHLPVPGDHSRRKKTLHEKRHEALFDEAQARRDIAFEDGIQRRRRMFTENEMRRQLEFEVQQRKRKDEFKMQEHKSELDFIRAERVMEEHFWKEEKKKEASFTAKEAARDLAFETSQKQREERFHIEMESLRKECYEAEVKRQADMEQWSEELFKTLKERMEGGHWRLERILEGTFQRSLTFSQVKLRIGRVDDFENVVVDRENQQA